MISLFCLLWVLPDLCSCPQTVASIVSGSCLGKKRKGKKKKETEKKKKSLVYYCGRVAPSTGISYSLHIWTYWFWPVIIIMSFWEFTGDNVRPWSKAKTLPLSFHSLCSCSWWKYMFPRILQDKFFIIFIYLFICLCLQRVTQWAFALISVITTYFYSRLHMYLSLETYFLMMHSRGVVGICGLFS